MVDQTDDRLAELLRDTAEAADAYMRGDMAVLGAIARGDGPTA